MRSEGLLAVVEVMMVGVVAGGESPVVGLGQDWRRWSCRWSGRRSRERFGLNALFRPGLMLGAVSLWWHRRHHSLEIKSSSRKLR